MEGADPTQATTAAGLQCLLSYQQHLAWPAWQAESAYVWLQTCVHYTLCHPPAPLADLYFDACFFLSRSCLSRIHLLAHGLILPHAYADKISF